MTPSAVEHERPEETTPPSTIARLGHKLRTEAASPARQAAAIGVGFLIGCSPFFGLHLPLSLFAGWLFGLNRLKIYVAANISNPLVSPFLLFAEIQVGSWLKTGSFYPISVETLRELDIWDFAGDLLLGSATVGLGMGALGALATYAFVSQSRLEPAVGLLLEKSAERYLSSGLLAWEFAHSKLRYDPVYREILREGMLPETGTFFDLGCGRGLLLAALTEARSQYEAGEWPDGWPAPPRLRLVGIETQARAAKIAQTALGEGAEIDNKDLTTAELPVCHATALIDVLHYLQPEDQHALLHRLAETMLPRGVLLIREANADGGRRFFFVRASERLRALLRGHWRQRFSYRSTRDWAALLELAGFSARWENMGQGTPFANVLLRADRKPTMASAALIDKSGMETR